MKQINIFKKFHENLFMFSVKIRENIKVNKAKTRAAKKFSVIITIVISLKESISYYSVKNLFVVVVVVSHQMFFSTE